MSQQKSAKDIAFDKERLAYRQKINALNNKIAYWEIEFENAQLKYKHAEDIILKLDEEIDVLSKKLDIPRETLLADIERTKKAADALETLLSIRSLA